MGRFLRSLLVLSAVALTQCATGSASPVRIDAETRIAVSYEQPRQALRQSILGERLVDPASFYSAQESDKLAKVATNEQLRILLDGLADCGFFDRAGNASEADAASSIRVEVDGVPRVWSLTPRQSPADRASYHQALAWFQNVYNQIGAFHTGGGNTRLEDEHERLRRNFEARTGGRRERP